MLRHTLRAAALLALVLVLGLGLLPISHLLSVL